MTKLNEKLIEKFLSRTITDKEMVQLLTAYEKNQISEEQLDAFYRAKWEQSAQDGEESVRSRRDIAWTEFRQYIQSNAKPKSKRNIRWMAIAGGVAVAVLFFALGLSVALTQKNPFGKELVVSVENGQKARVQLPDGSHVNLNSASELRYAPDFGKKRREIELSGEACFDIKSDREKPFIVKTHGGLNIRALGTKFNVKSYRSDKRITTTLIEGVIEVTGTGFSEILAPKDKIIFYPQSGRFRKSRVENENEPLFWMTDQFVCKGETLESIAKTLERMYNVTVTFDNEDIKKIRYSGIIKNNNLENVLDLITTVSPLRYTINDSNIILSTE